MMFYLKIQSPGQSTRNETTVRAGCFHLGLEPAHWLSGLLKVSRGIAVRIFEIVRESEQGSQSKTFGQSHQHNVTKGFPSQSVIHERGYDVAVNVQETEGDGELDTTMDKRIVHLNSNRLRAALLQIKNLWIKHRGKPVKAQDRQKVKGLELVCPGSSLVSQGIIVEKDQGFSAVTIRIVGSMIGVGMVGPMLFAPQPLASTNKVRTKSQDIVDKMIPGRSSVVGIVLHI